MKTGRSWTEAVPASTNYIRPLVIDLVKRAGAHSVLDVGCGNGVLCDVLADAGFKVAGIDGDVAAISMAARKSPHIKFAVAEFDGSPQELEFMPLGGFDAVVSTEVVEHLFSPHELAKYCFSALKAGGFLVLSTPYHGYLKNLVLSIVDGWDKHHEVHNLGGHIKFFSRKTLTKLLEDAGFKVIGFRGAGRFPYLWKSMILLARKP